MAHCRALPEVWQRLRGRALLLPSHKFEIKAGGLPGPECEAFILTLLQEHDQDEWPFGYSLDFSKAFDSVDWATVLQIFDKIGVPQAVLKPLHGQWSVHKRWFSYGKSIDYKPLNAPAALLPSPKV